MSLNIYQKLLEVKKQVDYIQKKRLSPDLKYNAVSNSMVLAEINKELNEQGLLLKTSVVNKDIQRLERMNSKGLTYDFIATLDFEFTWVNVENQEKDVNLFSCSGLNSDPAKAFGSCLTYAEKYFFLKFFNIATDDLDPDTFSNLYKTDEERQAEIEAQEKAKKEAEIEAYYSKVKQFCINEAPKDSVNAYYTAIHNKYISKASKLKDDKRFNDLVEKHKPETKEPSNEFEDALNSSKKIVVGV